jgi:hypothetical protein
VWATWSFSTRRGKFAFVMLERDRRPQLISVVDVVGVDGVPPPLLRSQYVFAAVWASGADVAAVYGAS